MSQPQQPEPSLRALANLVQRAAPWLLALGSWIFGGLIAFNLIVLTAMVNIRPPDTPILIAMTAFACALPLNLTGLVLLRVIQDMREIGLHDLSVQAFQEAGFPAIEAHLRGPAERQARNERGLRLSLAYCFAIAAITICLTSIGFAAALWHVEWWISAALGGAVVLCAAVVALVAAHFVAAPPE